MTGESSKALPETAENRSSSFLPFRRLEPVAIVVFSVGVAGALLAAISEFVTLRSITVLTASCDDLATPSLRGECVTRGHEEHSYALLLMGIVALLMVYGAVMGRSRPAALGLLVIGVAVLVIAFATDVPNIHKTGVLGDQFDSAKAEPGPGLWMEIAGGAAMFAAGAMALTLRRRPPRRRRPA